MLKLKPCPFCGKELDLNDPDTVYPNGIYWRDTEEYGRVYFGGMTAESDGRCMQIVCSDVSGGCCAEMHGDSLEDVVDKWNNRV